MRGATLHPVRFAIDLDRSTIRNEPRAPERSAGDRRARYAATQPEPGESASFGVYPAARIPGRGCRLRGPFQGRDQFSQPESIPAGHTAGGGGTFYAREWRDF